MQRFESTMERLADDHAKMTRSFQILMDQQQQQRQQARDHDESEDFEEFKRLRALRSDNIIGRRRRRFTGKK